MIHAPSRSPYLGMPTAATGSKGINKRNMDKSGEPSNRKKESMLANANFKSAMLNQAANSHALAA